MLLRLGLDRTANMENSLAGNNYLRLFDLLDLVWPQEEPMALNVPGRTIRAEPIRHGVSCISL